MKLTFNELRQKSSRPENRFIGRILAFDPGETTGYACFEASEDDVKLVQQGQVKTWPLDEGLRNIEFVITAMQPDKVVFESYQVYEWKASEHSWSQVPTIQIIGMIRTLLLQMAIPEHTQTAQIAKNFCTDEKLTEWGYWIKGARHARDAIRHALYYLLFHKKAAQ